MPKSKDNDVILVVRTDDEVFVELEQTVPVKGDKGDPGELSGTITYDRVIGGPNIATFATKDELANKVSKDGTKVLSDQNFTLVEKQKLANQSGTNTGDEDTQSILNKIGYTPANQQGSNSQNFNAKDTYQYGHQYLSNSSISRIKEITPIAFGAVGNANYYNSSDQKWYTDSSHTILAHDDTSAFQSMLSALTSSATRIFIPDGNYLISSQLSLSHKDGMLFEGSKNAVIQKSTVFTNYAIFNFTYCSNIIFRTLTFKGNTQDKVNPNWGDDGLRLFSTDHVIIENCCFKDFGDGAFRIATASDDADTSDSNYYTIVKNTFDNCQQTSTTAPLGGGQSIIFQNNMVIGLKGSIKFASRKPGAKELLIKDNIINGSLSNAFEIVGYSDVTADGNIIKDCATYAFNIYSNSSAAWVTAWDYGSLKITNNNVENCAYGIRVNNWYAQDNTMGNLSNVDISYNVLRNITNTDITSGIVLQLTGANITNVRIEGNLITNCTVYKGIAIELAPLNSRGFVCKNISVVNNNLAGCASTYGIYAIRSDYSTVLDPLKSINIIGNRSDQENQFITAMNINDLNLVNNRCDIAGTCAVVQACTNVKIEANSLKSTTAGLDLLTVNGLYCANNYVEGTSTYALVLDSGCTGLNVLLNNYWVGLKNINSSLTVNDMSLETKANINGNLAVDFSAKMLTAVNSNITGIKTLTSSASYESAPLGPEMLSSADSWVLNSGWTGSFASGFSHTSGTGTITNTTMVPVATNKYQVAYTVTGRTAGSFTISLGGQTSYAISATGTWGPAATTNGSLIITPTSDFNGTVTLSVKNITTIYSPVDKLIDSTGTTINEARATNSSLNNMYQGIGCGRYTTTGNLNYGAGYQALYNNTTGYANVAIGLNAAQNTTSSSNVAIGSTTLQAATSNGHTIVGSLAGQYITSGGYNTVIGYNAANSITTGGSNTFIGYNAGYSASQLISATNSTAIGANSYTTASNQMVYGDSNITEHLFAAGTVKIPVLRHTGSTLGFYNTIPITKPTITGSRGGNQAVASILTQLALLGLITDGTTV